MKLRLVALTIVKYGFSLFCRFQELDLSTNAYIFSGSVREEEWYNKVVEGLQQKANYKKVYLNIDGSLFSFFHFFHLFF